MQSMPSNKEIIQQGYEAFKRRDIPAVLALFDPDIVWELPPGFPVATTYRKREGVLQFFSTLPSLYDELHVEPDEYLEIGDLVIARGHHRGHIGHKKFEIPFAMFWTMKNGLATHFLEYSDTGVLHDELRAKAAVLA